MKKRPYIAYILIISIVLLTVLTIGVTGAEQDYIVCSGIKIYKTEGTFIIPSGTSLSEIEYHASSGSFSYGGNRCPSGTKIDVSKGEKVEIYDSYGYSVMIDGKRVNFLQSSEIPFISIETSMMLSMITKSNRDEYAETKIFDETGKEIYSDEKNESFSELKVRGNATASYRKKPYQLKLGKKTDILGMGKAKTYILLANYIDPSYMRNEVAFSLASELGLDYTPEYRQVMLYINGECKGLYLLCEKTQINSNRIEIFDLEEENDKCQKDSSYKTRNAVTAIKKDDTDLYTSSIVSYSYIDWMTNPEDITGGYLVELDNLYAGSEKCKFTTVYGNTYVIKSPECASFKEVMYISRLFGEMEEAIYSDDGYNSLGRHFSEYIDIDSLAKIYVVEEMAKEWDAFVGSQYFYKDRDKDGVTSKIYAGPVWDFDNSWGTMTQGTYASDKTGLWSDKYSTLGRPNAKNHLGLAIASQPILNSLISEYSETASEILLSYASKGGMIDNRASILKDSSSCDKVVWGYTGRQSAFIVYESFTDGTDDTENTATGYLKDFINQRSVALNEYFKYSLDETYGKISDESNKITLNSEYFEFGKQASFRYSGNPSNLEIKDGQGNKIEFEFKEGFVYFTMPDSDVFVYVNNKDPETTQTETQTETEVTEITTNEETTEKEETKVPEKYNRNFVTMILLLTSVLLLTGTIVIIIISRRKEKTEKKDV